LSQFQKNGDKIEWCLHAKVHLKRTDWRYTSDWV